MINLDYFKGKSFFVYGLGKTGIATVNALLNSKIPVLCWDDQGDSMILPDAVKSSLKKPEEVNWQNINYLVLSPGVPLHFPEPHQIVKTVQGSSTVIYSDIEMLYQSQKKRNKFIGITGTNGKSTTTSLINHMLLHSDFDSQIGGNIGIPVMDLNPFTKSGNFVLEMSSFQLDLINEVRFNTAAILNITKDHIDRHGSMENYVKAKCKIFKHQTSLDYAVFGIDNPITNDLYRNLNIKSHKIPVSTLKKDIDIGVYLGEEYIKFNIHNHKGKISFKSPRNLPGQHNRENMAIAFAIGMLYNISPESVIKSFNNFTHLPHRLEYLGDMANISFYNDSKSTNAESSIAALTSFKNIYWIVGGVPKDGGLEALTPYLANVRKAFLIGQSQHEFAKFFDSHKVNYKKCGTLENAFTDAALEATQCIGHVNIILSPACASYDQFKNFEHRGNEFKRIFEYFYAQTNGNKIANFKG